MNELEQIINAAEKLLYENPIAVDTLEYLDQRIPRQTQEQFKFGYLPPVEQLSSLLIDSNVLLSSRIFFEDKNNGNIISTMQQHNLIMPYRDVYGRIIAIVGRTLLDDVQRQQLAIPKYKNTSFKKSRHLFGLYEAKQTVLDCGYVYVVEGQFDCISAHSKGITNVVALGSASMSMEQLILLLRYTNKIVLLLDNDEAGGSGRKMIIEKFGKYAGFSNAYIPEGFKDLDELLKEVEITSSEELLLSLK